MPRRVYPNLSAYFRDSGETLTQVAAELGISLPYMSMIKAGERQPSLSTALKIAARCHVPLESLIRKPFHQQHSKAS
jgi:transcriptional regulator with XRE-family HTH domain